MENCRLPLATVVWRVSAQPTPLQLPLAASGFYMAKAPEMRMR